MRIPIISSKEANTREDALFPELDRDARIVLDEKDGKAATFLVQNVKCMDFISTGKGEIPFWLNGVRDKSWEVIITDRRICVYNPFSKGLIGAAKEKRGKSTVGHLYFDSISNLSTFFEKGAAVLLVVCYRKDGTKSCISIEEGDPKMMKQLAMELHKRLEKYISSNNLKIIIDDKTEAGIKKAVEKWNSFPEIMWTNNTGEVSVFVPCNEWKRVADSRLS